MSLMRMLPTSIDVYPAILLLSAALGVHGVRKGSLNSSGGRAAAILGWASLANPNWSFGVLLLVFYFSGSRATKVNAEIKAGLERESTSTAPNNRKAGHKSATGGQRNAWQVVCNALARGCQHTLMTLDVPLRKVPLQPASRASSTEPTSVKSHSFKSSWAFNQQFLQSIRSA